MVFVLQASAFNVNYSDSGLFGFYTISQAAHAGEVSGHLECGCWQPVSEQHGAVPELQKQLVGWQCLTQVWAVGCRALLAVLLCVCRAA